MLARTGTRSRLHFVLNGEPVTVDNADPRTTVLEFVRSRDARLTGTKLGCGEGGCGACTVLVSRYEGDNGGGCSDNGLMLRHRSINACLAPLCSVDGAHVTTVEGVGTAEQPHPAQERIAKLHGSQCGFCTPGIVMALYAKLANNPAPTAQELEETFDGNLCRCTGYRPILDAAKTFAVDIEDVVAMPSMPSSACTACPNREQCGLLLESETAEIVLSTTRSRTTAPRPEEQWNVAFDPNGAHAPPNLPVEYAAIAREALEVSKTLDDGTCVTWHRPATLAGLLAIKRAHPEARLIAGNTEVGIETKIGGCKYAHLVAVSPALRELLRCEHDATSNSLVVGSAVTLTALKTALEAWSSAAPGAGPAALTSTAALGRILSWFASSAIRNGASVGGNVCTASPIGDLMPLLIAAGATFTAAGANDATGAVDTRPIPASEWLVGYRRTSLKPHELLLSIEIPCTPSSASSSSLIHVATAYKQSRRREDDISIVTGAFTAAIDSETRTVAKCVAAFGGVAPQTMACPAVAEALLGALAPFDAAVLQRVREAVAATLPLGPSTPGGMPAFRQSCVASMVERFGLEIAQALKNNGDGASASDAASYMARQAPVTSGRQQFTRDPVGGNLTTSKTRLGGSSKKRRGAYGEPVPHQAGLLHATGEAEYTDDVEEPRGLHFAAPVLSDRPTGSFEIPATAAVAAMPGVVRVVTARDVRGKNEAGPIPPYDEELFRTSEVTAAGQLIALVVADTQERANNAARALDVVYATNAVPVPVITIPQSLAAAMTNPAKLEIISGDTASAFARKDGVVVVEGIVRINGQEHFYLEPSGAVVTPRDGGAELEVLSSCQGPSPVHGAVAKATGMPMHKITSGTKRLGGGFGGKGSRMMWVAAATAVAAQLTKRPVKFILDRQTDMLTQGTRHPFMGKYTLGADPATGKLVALELELFNNAGYAKDVSVNVMKWALLHCTNAYKIPNVTARGTVCHTNTANNTAFRGFGAPQAMFIIESAMEAMALKLGLPDSEFRHRNLFAASGDVGHHGQEITGNPVPRLWHSIQSPQHADFARRQAEVDAFNRTHTHKKRGIALLPTIYGIGFETKFMNQGGCNVNIYTDGTVKVIHGGTEMGQGLHTKVVQLVASTLGIPHECVFVSQSSTDHIPNATSTAGSVSFDLYGSAALSACEQLNDRLAPYLPGDWHEGTVDDSRRDVFTAAVSSAYFDRVDLCAHGFFINHSDYNFAVPSGPERGTPFNYYTTGVACSECEVDLLSGDMRVLRADILMDLGISPNPAIDIGQVEGAYVQGMGYFTLEETVWGSTDEHRWLKPGQCFTRGPGNFKIPSSNDVPVDMRVTLLGEAPNPRAVHSSKAVGEPPLFLGATAAFAARNAVRAALAGHASHADHAAALQHTDSPFSAERLRMMVGDATAKYFTEQLQQSSGGSPHPALFC